MSSRQRIRRLYLQERFATGTPREIEHPVRVNVNSDVYQEPYIDLKEVYSCTAFLWGLKKPDLSQGVLFSSVEVGPQMLNALFFIAPL